MLQRASRVSGSSEPPASAGGGRARFSFHLVVPIRERYTPSPPGDGASPPEAPRHGRGRTMKLHGTWQLKGRAGIVLGLVVVASAVSGVAFLGAKGAPQQRTNVAKTAPQAVPATTPSTTQPTASSA